MSLIVFRKNLDVKKDSEEVVIVKSEVFSKIAGLIAEVISLLIFLLIIRAIMLYFKGV